MIPNARRQERRRAHREPREVLLARLTEAEETLEALREGEVDALVVRGSGGDRIYTLHGAEEPYRILVEQMREGALILAPSGDILYCNARFAALVGETLESVLGTNINRFIADGDRLDFTSLLKSGNGTRRSRLVTAEGTSLDVYFSLTTSVSSKGSGNLSLIVADLSELLEARSGRDRAEHDSQAKNEFMATLAHEFRTPLAAINGAAAVLEAEGATGEQARCAREVIARQAGHLARLIDDLLDVERAASGKIRLDRHPLDAAAAVRRAVATVTESPGPHPQIDVTTEPLWVDGDAVRFEQVLANLLTNAVKYTPLDGCIRVSLRGDGTDVVLSVQDTGFGIAPELLPSIFDMFMQAESTLHRARGGLGLGLALVRRLVELHGGTIAASSAGIGRGSTFTVRLPGVQGPAVEAALPSAIEPTAPKRVLIIEDSRDARDMFRTVLELAGHTVYEAGDGVRGLDLANTLRPEVAVIDIGIPGLDGYEVARRIREQPESHGMLLLAVTGDGSPDVGQRSAEAGFDRHLVKLDPFDLTRLLSEPVAANSRTPPGVAATRISRAGRY